MQNCMYLCFISLEIARLIQFATDSQGDKICIFGFSRGAYTARALAGMLQKACLYRVLSFRRAHDIPLD